ncbi:hypothetical protein [Bradyrhizobium sp. LA7.1]|uniref:hypothetical protein n=1 Tax=Bradyrhizobium sp. LA7.1 TaxID=3156324 RepID=UPI003397355B
MSCSGTHIVSKVVAASREVSNDSHQEPNIAGDGGVEALIDEVLSILQGLLVDQQRRIELERADAARMTLELAASSLESIHTNDLYRRALLKAAKMLREQSRNVLPDR